MNRLFGFGLGKCCDCSCCSGGGGCEAWTEAWASEAEVEENWEILEPISLSEGALVGGEVQASVDGYFVVSTTIGAAGEEGEAAFSVSNSLDFGMLGVSVSWNAESSPVWAMTISDVGDEISPSNPTDPQDVLIWWNSDGDFYFSVGDVVVSGFSMEFGFMATAQASADGTGFVGPVTMDCNPYNPDAEFWETQDGSPYETQSGEPWEMQ